MKNVEELQHPPREEKQGRESDTEKRDDSQRHSLVEAVVIIPGEYSATMTDIRDSAGCR